MLVLHKSSMNHTEKWNQVCEELKVNHPHSNVTLWVSGYVFGLTHAADMASRLPNTAGNAQAKCTHPQHCVSRDKDK